LDSNDSAYDHSIANDRRERSEPLVVGMPRPEGSEQCGNGTENDIQRTVRTKQVGDQTTQKQTGNRSGGQEGEHTQRLRETALYGTVGDSKYGGEICHHGIECGNDTGGRKITDIGFWHEKRPPSFQGGGHGVNEDAKTAE
jgi:hypothetical protein